MNQINLKILIIVITLLVSAAGLSAQDLSIAANINSNFVVVNREAILTVTVEGQNARDAGQPDLPDFGDWFAFGGSRGTSQSISIVNGKVSASLSYQYSLIPLKKGNVNIPAISITYKDKKYSSKAFDIEIRDAGTSPSQPQGRQRNMPGSNPAGNTGEIDIFLVAIPEKTDVFKNEGVTVEYKVYFASNVSISEYSPLNMPNSPGFWTEEYQIIGNPTAQRESYNEKFYNAAVLKRIELFPTASGELELDPIQMEFSAKIPSGRRSNIRSFFDDPFFDRPKKVRVASNKLNINVKELPTAGRPASFDGLVGEYDIKATIDQNRVKANESVTLRVEILGTGNIKLIDEPDIVIKGGLYEKYDPQISDDINRTGRNISGKKIFEYVIIPRTEGELKIEPLVLSYFDTRTGRYNSKRTKEFSIKIDKSDRVITSTPSGLSRDEVRLIGTDIRFIKESVEKWMLTGQNYYTSFGFLSLLILPLMIIGGAFSYSRHLDRLNQDVGYRRSRKATVIAMKRLKTTKELLDKEENTGFYPEVAKALQEYIADKLNIAAAGIVTDELEKIMSDRNIQADLAASYVNLLRKCDFYRFSSTGSSPDEMKAIYDESSDLIVSMEEQLKGTF